jgi:hypothetical protein
VVGGECELVIHVLVGVDVAHACRCPANMAPPTTPAPHSAAAICNSPPAPLLRLGLAGYCTQTWSIPSLKSIHVPQKIQQVLIWCDHVNLGTEPCLHVWTACVCYHALQDKVAASNSIAGLMCPANFFLPLRKKLHHGGEVCTCLRHPSSCVNNVSISICNCVYTTISITEYRSCNALTMWHFLCENGYST